jgi:hypothetical protein
MFSSCCEAHAENGTVNAESLTAQNQRRHQMDNRLVRPQASSATGATTSVAELANLRANTGKASTFTVFIEVRRSTTAGSVDKILGKTCVPYPETTTFGGKIRLMIDYSIGFSHFIRKQP